MCLFHSEIFWIALTAIATWAVAWVTYSLIKEEIQESKLDAGINREYSLEEKFYGERMKKERKKLAHQILGKASHDDIQDDVMNFFDTVGTLLRRGAIDEELVCTGLGFYIIGWWTIVKAYIQKERKFQKNNNTLFEDFEKLYERMIEFEMKKNHLDKGKVELNNDDIDRFLKNECNV